MKYFAYGSNMSENNLKNRGVIYSKRQKGILKGYKFIINKKSYKDPTIGFANIIIDENSFVEGVLYDVKETEILKLDKFEGFPKHYYKSKVYVDIGGFFEEAIVYIAQTEWTSITELKTTEEYRNKILEGKDSISDEYFQFLNENIKVENGN